MQNPAPKSHPIHELLERRWSPRAFAERPVEVEKLLSVLEAARWAPSSFNEQPWRFIVARREDADAYQLLLECLVEGNRVWASRAPVLALSVARMRFERNNQPNRHAFHDVGMAILSLTLQATALGLAVHQMAGFDPDRARQAFRIPEGFDPVAAMALGYPGEPEDLPEKLRARETTERTRKSLRELVFANQWGEPAPLVPREPTDSSESR